MWRSPGTERPSPCHFPANGAGVWGTTGNSANLRLRTNRSVARGGGSTQTMAALYSAHQPQPVQVPGLRPPPPPPSPPPSFSARPALEVQPGVGGEGEIDAAGQGSVAAPLLRGAAEQPLTAEIMSASGAAGVSSAGKTIETNDRLSSSSTAGDGQVGRPGRAARATRSTSEGEARQRGREVGEAAGGAATGSARGGDVEWCPQTARDRACEAVPVLSKGFRKFDEKHPGATIM